MAERFYVAIQRQTATGFKTGFLAGPYASKDDVDPNVREAPAPFLPSLQRASMFAKAKVRRQDV
jgi:hypothetical protein